MDTPASVTLPPGSDGEEAPSLDSAHAYLRNPVAGKERLTPLEALDAISLLAAMLLADEGYRAVLAARVATIPGGENS